MEKKFNLLDEPWILAMDGEGQTCKLSLIEVLVRAHELRGLAGEMPTQDAAILRLLVAVLYGAFGREELPEHEVDEWDGVAAMDRWQWLWGQRCLPKDILRRYLAPYHERFYLVHPTQPFCQAAFPGDKVQDSQGNTYVPGEMSTQFMIGTLSESENKPCLFRSRAREDGLAFDEAARWLAHLNAFDVAPTGAPPRGVIKVNGYSSAWLCKVGVLYAQGDTFFQTLLLNLVFEGKGGEVFTTAPDSLYWEMEHVHDGDGLQDITLPLPASPGQLYSQPFRLLQLQTQEDRVVGYRRWTGWKYEGFPNVEIMTAWREGKKNEPPSPKRHNSERMMWRDLPGILAMKGDQESCLIVQWLIALRRTRNADSPPLPRPRLCAVGMQLDSKGASVESVFFDTLSLNASLLEGLDQTVVTRLENLLATTEKCVWAIGLLAKNLSLAAGDSGKSPGEGAAAAGKGEAYFALDMPFRDWLVNLEPKAVDNDTMDAAEVQWVDTLERILTNLAQQWVSGAGETALIGRTVDGELYSAPKAMILFRGILRKTLHPNQTKEGGKQS